MEEMINKILLELNKNDNRSSYAQGVFDVLCAVNTLPPFSDNSDKFGYLLDVYNKLKSLEDI